MTNIVALDGQTHRALRVAVAGARGEHASISIVGVIPREFPRLLAHYPIFFVKSPETGQFEPAALLGFATGENLFFSEGEWDVAYVPLQIQRRPFALISRPGNPATGTEPSLDLALDLSSPHVSPQHGERLFQDDGQPSPFLHSVSSMMKALVAGSREAHAFAGKLAELNLLEPVRVEIEFVDASDTQLQGLYWIAADGLKALAGAQLAELRDREYLEWMYFQMASLAHVSGLVDRKNRRLSGVTPASRGGVGGGGAGDAAQG
ncbi:MAG: SapC family protein [Pseudomonadota bacterium]|nr:SapC family protein [Pseudomonadota bacterium]